MNYPTVRQFASYPLILILMLIGLQSTSDARRGSYSIDTTTVDGKSVVHVSKDVLAKFASNSDSTFVDSILSDLGFGLNLIIDNLTWVVATYDTDEFLEEMIDSLLGSPHIYAAHPNFIYEPAGSCPNDHLFADTQWSFWHTEESTWSRDSCWMGVDISWLPASWITKGSRDVRIMVADQGIPITEAGILCHPDLGNPDYDDPTRVILGSNFSTDACAQSLGLPRQCCPGGGKDYPFHGALVAGVVGAAENDTGLVGVSPECELYIVKVYSETNDPVTSNRLRAMKEAVDSNCHIINLSSSLPKETEYLDELAFDDWMQILEDNHIFFVTVSWTREDSLANSEYSNLIAVTATDCRDSTVDGYISEGINVYTTSMAAPGRSLLSATACCDPDPTCDCGSHPGQDWISVGSGRSYAIPHVSGALGLMRAHYGFGIDADSMRTLLFNSADKVWQWKFWPAYDPDSAIGDSIWLNSNRHPAYGYGRLNVFRALTINDGFAGHIRKDNTIWKIRSRSSATS